jgi:pyruvate/2-oxoglutarate dehydrogenase complex dihydrolipoamide acyltransferase (E2) component
MDLRAWLEGGKRPPSAPPATPSPAKQAKTDAPEVTPTSKASAKEARAKALLATDEFKDQTLKLKGVEVKSQWASRRGGDRYEQDVFVSALQGSEGLQRQRAAGSLRAAAPVPNCSIQFRPAARHGASRRAAGKAVGVVVEHAKRGVAVSLEPFGSYRSLASAVVCCD